jgi:transaldolase
MQKLTFNRGIFLDSSNVKEIEKWNAAGIIDGVTTNQSIMLKDGITLKQLEPTIKKICSIMKGRPVSIELTDSSASVEEMIKEAQKFRKLASNIVVKVPIIPGSTKSLVVIQKLGALKIPVNVTAMMTYGQLLTAALAIRNHPAPSFVSLFWARTIEDHEKYRTNSDFIKAHPTNGPEAKVDAHPSEICAKLEEFIRTGGYNVPKIIVGSIRNASQVSDAFAAGAHIVTIQPHVLEAMLFSQRTVETNADFDKSWLDLKKKS